MEDKKDDKESAKPLIPTLKDSKPQVKIKGLPSAMSLFDRLKQFKKKDLTFILAGLGVLFMAPLAEHFMMTPETGDANGAFKEGWGFRDGAGGLGKGGSPYEPGVSGLAPGSLLGGGSDVITPLNVRDPSALVMGPGATQQTPVSSPPPAPAAASKSSSSDWKDALANAASHAAPAVQRAASLPVPKIPLQGALRGLGAVSGGGGGSFSLAPISANNVPNKAAGSNAMQRVVAPTGFRGAANARGSSSPDTGGLAGLKAAANNAAGEMNRGGGAAGNLDNAAQASQALGGGGSDGGSGAGGAGGNDKNASQNSASGARNQGESLAFLAAKTRMEKDLEYEYKKQEAKDMDLKVWLPMRDAFFKDMASGLTKGLLLDPWMKKFGDAIDGIGKDTKAIYICQPANGSGYVTISASKVTGIGDLGGTQKKDDTTSNYILDNEGTIRQGQTVFGVKCQKQGGADTASTGGGEDRSSITDMPRGAGGTTVYNPSLSCDDLITHSQDTGSAGEISRALLTATQGSILVWEALKTMPSGKCMTSGKALVPNDSGETSKETALRNILNIQAVAGGRIISAKTAMQEILTNTGKAVSAACGGISKDCPGAPTKTSDGKSDYSGAGDTVQALLVAEDPIYEQHVQPAMKKVYGEKEGKGVFDAFASDPKSEQDLIKKALDIHNGVGRERRIGEPSDGEGNGKGYLPDASAFLTKAGTALEGSIQEKIKDININLGKVNEKGINGMGSGINADVKAKLMGYYKNLKEQFPDNPSQTDDGTISGAFNGAVAYEKNLKAQLAAANKAGDMVHQILLNSDNVLSADAKKTEITGVVSGGNKPAQSLNMGQFLSAIKQPPSGIAGVDLPAKTVKTEEVILKEEASNDVSAINDRADRTSATVAVPKAQKAFQTNQTQLVDTLKYVLQQNGRDITNESGESDKDAGVALEVKKIPEAGKQ